MRDLTFVFVSFFPPGGFAQVFRAGEVELIRIWREDVWGSHPIVLRWCRVIMIVIDWQLFDPEDKALICEDGFKKV